MLLSKRIQNIAGNLHYLRMRSMLHLLLAMIFCSVSAASLALVPIPKQITLRREAHVPTHILLQVGDRGVVIEPCELPSLLSTEPQVSFMS